MSSTRREVVFSARDEVSQKLSRIQQTSQDMARDSIAEAMKNETSANRVLEAYEKQIKAIERRNKLDAETQKNELYAERDEAKARTTTIAGAKAVDQKFKPKFAELGKATREDKQQTNILRDILQSIKDGDEDIVASNEELANQSNEKLRETIAGGGPGQKSALHELKVRQLKKPGGGGGGPNAMSLMKGGIGGLAALGIAGVAIGGLFKLIEGGFDVSSKREVGLTDYSAMSGQDNTFLSKYTGAGRGSGLYNNYMYGGKPGTSAQSLGFSSEDYYSALGSGTRAYGGSEGVIEDNNRTIQSLSLRRGMGMEAGTVSALERLTRTLDGDATAGDTTQRIFSAMYNTGAMGDKNTDMTRMNEMAQTYAQFQESQFTKTGLIGGGNEWLNMRSQLEGMGGAYKRDDYAASTIESFSGGLSQAGGPESQAIKMDILRKLNPKMSYFELQAEMEKGIGAEGFAGGMMDFVKNTGGDENSQAILMEQLTGGSMRKEDILNMLRGGVDMSGLGAEAETKDMKLMEKAKGATSDKDAFMKNIESDWEGIKEAIFNISTNTSGMTSMGPLLETLMAVYK